ncbi:MAG: efflux RND transporter periplasmic adaptor subunit [Alphaproteobacteria bacterium]
MDGDLKTFARVNEDRSAVVSRTPAEAPARRKPKLVRWFVIVGLLLALVLGGLYGFNRFRDQAIKNFFASNKPPPAQVAAVKATTTTVPRSATGIGSLEAVQEVTITPEVGGRVTDIMFNPGEAVKAGDPLVQLNDAPDRADLANYEAQARWAAASLERAKVLAQRQVGPQQNVDQWQSQLDQARAQILKTQAIIDQKKVKAPFSGRLGIRQVNLGEIVTTSTKLVTLTDLHQLYANFTLPSTMRDKVKLGQEVEITVDAFPGRIFKAKVTTIEPQVRSDTRMMSIQATLPNPDEALLPGMFVNAAVILPPGPPDVVLPETAVDYTLYGDSVYLVREDGNDAQGKPVLKAIRTPVTTGKRWDGKVAVLSGVKPGDTVVAAGQVKLQDGASVVVTGEPPPPPAKPTLQ